jgi:hypothetical protein
MAIVFPQNPTLNQTFTSGSTTWFWTGYAWKLSPITDPAFNSLSVTTSITVGAGGGVGGSNIFGNLSGNVTGNVTGNVSGSSSYTTGNAATATSAGKLTTPIRINGVSFDGSANISVPSLVNGTYSVNLDSNGYLNLPNGADTNGAKINSSSSIRIISNNNTWTYASNGSLTAPGSITTSTGTISASAMQTTNDITVGGNVNVSTSPTLNSHAANKQYVDIKATALSIALS